MTQQELMALEAEVQEEFPDLIVRQRGDSIVAEGTFSLFENGKAADQFAVRVELPPESPKGYPTLFEIGGRIPAIPDRHVNEGAMSCCVLAVDELLFKYPNGCSLLDFLRGPVRDFFISQSYFESNQDWPFGARSHGLEGRVEFYAEQVGCHDVAVGLRVLFLIAAATASSKADCPCGSRRRLRRCHREVIRHLRERIPRRVARDLLAGIEKGIEWTSKPKGPTDANRLKRRRWWPTS